MTPSPAATAVAAPRAQGRACCRRPMTSIEVTATLADPLATLALYTCSGCGRHVWERNGVELDRSAVLDVVRDRISEGPAPRVPRARKPRTAPVMVPTAVPEQERREMRERLAAFEVHGR